MLAIKLCPPPAYYNSQVAYGSESYVLWNGVSIIWTSTLQQSTIIPRLNFLLPYAQTRDISVHDVAAGFKIVRWIC